MLISTNHGFTFLCVPKCASTSIEAAIKSYCNINFKGGTFPGKHMNARNYNKFVIPLLKNLVPHRNVMSFCLMRDPLEWIGSWFRYRARKQLSNPSHRHHKYYTGNVSFEDFILEYMSEGERKPFANLRSQYEFVSLDNGRIGPDYIIPLTRMDIVEELLSEKLGRNIQIPFKNTTSGKNKLSLPPDIQKRLEAYLAKDICLYNFIQDHVLFDNKKHANQVFTALSTC